MAKMAILVDGGFYRARARNIFRFSRLAPSANADVLEKYCEKHVVASAQERRELYRIFYYDCPPVYAATIMSVVSGVIYVYQNRAVFKEFSK